MGTGKSCTCSVLCTIDASILMDGIHDSTLNNIGYISILLGIPALWFLYDRLDLNKFGAIKGSQYGFMIFVMHHPIISAVRKLLAMALKGVNSYTLLLYVLSPVITILIVIGISYIVKKYLNNFYAFVSGSR